jgi:hypothetical protein
MVPGGVDGCGQQLVHIICFPCFLATLVLIHQSLRELRKMCEKGQLNKSTRGKITAKGMISTHGKDKSHIIF